MTKVLFYYRGGDLIGFRLNGHTDSKGSTEAKIVCSAISSAAYMTANTVTDIIGDKADIRLSDSFIKLTVNDLIKCKTVLCGFKLHIEGLAEQYPQYIQILTEVQHNA